MHAAQTRLDFHGNLISRASTLRILTWPMFAFSILRIVVLPPASLGFGDISFLAWACRKPSSIGGISSHAGAHIQLSGVLRVKAPCLTTFRKRRNRMQRYKSMA